MMNRAIFTAAVTAFGILSAGMDVKAAAAADLVSKYDTDNDKTLDLAEVKTAIETRNCEQALSA